MSDIKDQQMEKEIGRELHIRLLNMNIRQNQMDSKSNTKCMNCYQCLQAPYKMDKEYNHLALSIL